MHYLLFLIYHGEVKRIFSTFLRFGIILVFLAILQTIPYTYAATANVDLAISKHSATLGESILVTVTNIPKGAATYTLSEGRLDAQKTLNNNASPLTFRFVDNSDFPDIPSTCSIYGSYNNAIWKEAQCNPDTSGDAFTFTAKIDTNNVGANRELTTTSSVLYGVALTSIQAGVRGASPPLREFTINAPSDQTTQTFDFTPLPLSPNPAKLGDEIDINITVNEAGDFTPFIQNYKENNNLVGTKKNCNAGACTLKFTIPNDIVSSTINIGVQDFNGYAKTTPLTISNPKAKPTTTTLQVEITPWPTAIQTPTPPFQPCKTFTDVTTGSKRISPEELRKMINDGRIENPEYVGRDYKCIEVDTAIGPISTDPIQFIQFAFTVLLSMSGGWAAYLIIVAGYKLMFSHGEAEEVKEAREKITSAIVGIVFMLLSIIILRVIGVDIFDLPGFGN